MKKYWMPLSFVATLLIGVYVLMLAQPVQAQAVGSKWAKWVITTSFQNGVTDADLIVEIGYYDINGDEVPYKEETFDLSCQKMGNVTISNGEAIFDGTGYIRCMVPSIQNKVSVMSNGQYVIGASCSSKRPFVLSRATIDNSPNGVNPMNPVFYRHDIGLAVPFDTINQTAKMMSFFDNSGAQSGTFAVSGTEQKFVTAFNQFAPDIYNPIFRVDGSPVGSTPAVINSPILLSTLASIIFIGYEPVTGNYFQGNISSVVVDPVCVATG